MSVFSVYEPPQDKRSKAARSEDLIFVRDSFSRPHLVLGPIWLLVKQQWAGLAGYILLAACFSALAYFAGLPSLVWSYLYLGLNLIFALEEPLIRGTMLEAKGWRFVGVTEGQTQEEAEYRFLSSWLNDDAQSGSGTKPEVGQSIEIGASGEGAISPVLRDARPPRILN